jgi:hypothetical protein
MFSVYRKQYLRTNEDLRCLTFEYVVLQWSSILPSPFESVISTCKQHSQLSPTQPQPVSIWRIGFTAKYHEIREVFHFGWSGQFLQVCALTEGWESQSFSHVHITTGTGYWLTRYGRNGNMNSRVMAVNGRKGVSNWCESVAGRGYWLVDNGGKRVLTRGSWREGGIDLRVVAGSKYWLASSGGKGVLTRG